jgi:hypothetical protein
VGVNADAAKQTDQQSKQASLECGGGDHVNLLGQGAMPWSFTYNAGDGLGLADAAVALYQAVKRTMTI